MQVPMPVTVLKADELAANSQLHLLDYYASIPAFAVVPNDSSSQLLAIRGITTGSAGDNPTVGVTIDDVPFGGSVLATGGSVIPDFDPGDLARVEVLRGPQGTLYGSNSMGGIIKYVTKDPTFDHASGRIEAGLNGVHNGNEPGYDFRASANVPLSNTVAFRVSAFERQDAGYIDNPIVGIRGINQAMAYGGRLSLLWQPNESFSAKTGVLFQKIKGDGSSEAVQVPGYAGDLNQDFIRGAQVYNRSSTAVSEILNYAIGQVKLTSVTGYSLNKELSSIDFSLYYGTGTSGALYASHTETQKVSQELRAVVPIGERIEFLAAGFYSHDTTPTANKRLSATDKVTGDISGPLAFYDLPASFTEYAAFGTLTYHVSDRFEIQSGVRESRFKETDASHFSGPLFATPVDRVSRSDASAFTYLITPKFTLSRDLMLYARLASGYRPGGANTSGAIAGGAPAQFKPDKTQNYEVGLKGDFLEHILSVDASIYRINWNDIQIRLFNAFPYSSNGGDAKSEGIELSATLRPLRGLTISGWVAYDNAVLTNNFPAFSTSYGRAGDRLPDSAPWSGYLSVDESFALSDNMTGFVGGSFSVMGRRMNVFSASATAPRRDLPAYRRLDLQAGLSYHNWSGHLYVNNVGDERGILNRDAFVESTAVVYIQPRTVGLNVSRAF